MSLLSVVCCQVEVSAKGRSLVQMSLTECGVIEEPHRECLGPLALSSHEKKIINAKEVTELYVHILVQAVLKLCSITINTADYSM
jgi:hypothetical protein